MDDLWIGLAWGVAGTLTFLAALGILRAFVKVGRPDQTLVITGKTAVRNHRRFGFTVERGRTNVIPFFQHLDFLDLGVMPLNVQVEGVNSANGITVGADATACVCIDADDEGMLYSAVERLMGKSRTAIQDQLRQTLVGNFRGALNKATPLQAIGMDDDHDNSERAEFRQELLKDINSDLSHFGVKVVSVSLQKIWDTSNYIANLAQKTLARKRQEVEIQEAKLKAQADQAESDSARRIFVAKNEADEKILAARRKLELFRKESEAAIRGAALEADSAIQEAENRAQAQVQELTVALNRIRNRTGVTLEAEARRQAATLQAEGEFEAAKLVEGARNRVLETKAKLLKDSDEGALVLFVQQQLPEIYRTYQARTAGSQVDQYVVLENENGFNDAVNRGPAAFVDFLARLEAGFGISVKDYFQAKGGRP